MAPSLVRSLIIGDPHTTREELVDCEGLFQAAYEAILEHRPQVVIIMGDLYNSHDSVSVKNQEFNIRWLKRFKEAPGVLEVIVLRGNHDQSVPNEAYPHALLAHTNVTVVDRPMALPILPGVAAMPYYSDPAEFLVEAERLAADGYHTLLCHQTFDGSKYENGFYAKDGVRPDQVPFARIISGHIHTPQKVGKVFFPGAPRWRTQADANIDRHLWVFDHCGDKLKVVAKVATDTYCARIWKYEDRPEAPVTALDALTPERLKTDRIHINVFGPDPTYVREREAELKAKYGALTRGYPDRAAQLEVSEAMGIDNAFDKFTSHFVPPNGTPLDFLAKTVGERLAACV